MVTSIIAPTARKSVLTLDNCFDTRHLQIFARSFSSQDKSTVILEPAHVCSLKIFKSKTFLQQERLTKLAELCTGLIAGLDYLFEEKPQDIEFIPPPSTTKTRYELVSIFGIEKRPTKPMFSAINREARYWSANAEWIVTMCLVEEIPCKVLLLFFCAELSHRKYDYVLILETN